MMNEINDDVIYQDEEINLRELWKIIWSKKVKIVIFTFLVTTITIIYTLSLPNIYKSETLLAPSEQQGGVNLGGLSALAGLAGVDIGGGGKIAIDDKMNTLLSDYTFNETIIKKYDLLPDLIEGYESLEKKQQAQSMLDAYRAITKLVVISQDKKSSLISIMAEHKDPTFAHKLVNIYLEELTEYIRKQELKNINEKIEYYNQELSKATDAALKEQLSKLASALIQNKVLAKANRYYGVEQITKPYIADIREKVKPKRSLIVIVSFFSSLILGVLGVFLWSSTFNKESKKFT